MATMFRVTLPDGGPAAVTTGVVAFSSCGADELAVIVGDTVPRQRCGSELREALSLLAETPRDPDTSVAVGSLKTYVGAPGVPGDQLAAATVLGAAVPDETQWGVVLGANAAKYLDRNSLVAAAVERAFALFPSVLGQ